MAEQINPIFRVQTAVRAKSKASICIEGLSGKGKSGLALLLGYYLADKNWTKVGAVDTENKSLNLYVDMPMSNGVKCKDFKLGQLTKDIGFKPSNYLAFREALKDAKCEVAIFDSISHSWQQKGGVLDLVTQAKEKDKRYQKDSYAAWGEETVMQEKLNLIELYRDPDIHCITTVRVKEKMEYQYDESTQKTKLVSLGELQIQQADMKYEPDLVLRMIKPGSRNRNPIVEVVKSRYVIFEEGAEVEITPTICEQLVQYLNEGVDPEVLLEQQRQDYIQAVKEYLDSKPNAQPIWQIMKKDAGYDDTKLSDLPLDVIKQLFIKITMD